MAADKSPKESQPERRLPARNEAVPAPAVRRLSLYLRELEALQRQRLQTVSSRQLGQTLGYTDAQVRKDLAYFGQFGHPGIGYAVNELITRIRMILGTDRPWNVLLVGAGNLGQALLSYRGFSKKGFQIVAVFDNDPEKIGQRVGVAPPLDILPLEKLAPVVVDRGIEVGIISVPAEAAQSVADDLAAVGIKGILNFAPVSVTLPDNLPVASVDLTVHLEQLAFHVSTVKALGER